MLNGDEKEQLVDRAAYVYVTGNFPSHLRKRGTKALREITSQSRELVALDGRTGNVRLDERVAEVLELEHHPMVKEVRAKILGGYAIQPSRGYGERRPFWKIFMFKLSGDRIIEKITVQGDGAVKWGWE